MLLRLLLPLPVRRARSNGAMPSSNREEGNRRRLAFDLQESARLNLFDCFNTMQSKPRIL